ncbi:MAG: DUF1440 domain-containing protein [Saprospiraceae bacterium]|nr:DUF1440 domain-containing protein [Saprospiraceae bacterium]
MQIVQQPSFKTIVLAGIVAGAMDILAAILVYAIIKQATTPTLILQFIASGVFGKAAFAGGATMAFYGLIFHFLIAFSFAAVYALAFPHIAFLSKQKVPAGLLYGVLVWIVMNLTVLPLAFHNMPTFQLEGSLISIIILMLCVGLPISLIIHKRTVSR